MVRRRFLWKLKNREIQLGDRTLVAGILNVTPDSFSDGGQFLDPDRAYARALELEGPQVARDPAHISHPPPGHLRDPSQTVPSCRGIIPLRAKVRLAADHEQGTLGASQGPRRGSHSAGRHGGRLDFKRGGHRGRLPVGPGGGGGDP